MIINLNINIDDFNKIEKCKELYNKVLTTLSNCYPEDNVISEYKEDSEEKLILFCIEKSNQKNESVKIITVITLIGLILLGIYLQNIA